ncbi:hypothetical protein S40293_07334 [Stachybotrys chartarum IBT 40293]|nr:hypothetical protein S40293_07334 [Stachybotrys chartarum IBT 40293]
MDPGDSDFYGKRDVSKVVSRRQQPLTHVPGDEETASELQARVDRLDVEEWRQQHMNYPDRPQRRPSVPAKTSRLHNPYANVPYAWHLTETVDDFLKRLPPATTDVSESVPWIFICNPYIPRMKKEDGANQSIKGSEDEAPQEDGSKLFLVIEGGMERLELTKSFIDGLSKTGKSKFAIDKETRLERRKAAEDILNLAHAAKVRAGKVWMLFCSLQEVNEVWSVVAKATSNNELGIAAKVAPRDRSQDARRDRLICVYTVDFRDKADVGRVLRKLRQLKLVEARGRPIFYKPGK